MSAGSSSLLIRAQLQTARVDHAAADCRRAGGGETDGGDDAVVDVEAEELEVLSMASVMGVGRQDVERALLDSHGDWEFVMQVPLPAASVSPVAHVRLDKSFVQPSMRGRIHTRDGSTRVKS